MTTWESARFTCTWNAWALKNLSTWTPRETLMLVGKNWPVYNQSCLSVNDILHRASWTYSQDRNSASSQVRLGRWLVNNPEAVGSLRFYIFKLPKIRRNLSWSGGIKIVQTGEGTNPGRGIYAVSVTREFYEITWLGLHSLKGALLCAEKCKIT